jgi:aminopeptidase YwaD
LNADLAEVLAGVAGDPGLWPDFLAVCDCGGRLAGSESEKKAIVLAQSLLAGIEPGRTRLDTISYAGWKLHHASLELEGPGTALACHALVGSQSTGAGGLTAEVLDLGRGAPADFEAKARDIPGKLVLVRHEYMFAAETIHRRRKYNWALERGAAGFIIACPFPGMGTVCGSSGRGGGAGIPAVATDHASAAVLSSGTRARIRVSGEDFPAETQVAVLELPGRSGSWVVLSAHLDGHDLAESAMDNASGVAAALCAARALAPLVARCRRGLKLCLFSAEEWALAGSRQYVGRMSDAERAAIALNVNLDTVSGDARLTALTSGFPGLDAFVRDTAAGVGQDVGTWLPLMQNSDHYSFASHGIPALRLVAGFDAPASNVRLVLTPADTRDKVSLDELRRASALAAALAWKALNDDDAAIAALRNR